MYNTIRKIHLFSGLIILLFLMMYFVSGYVLIHRDFFGGQENKPADATRTERLTGFSDERSPEALAAHVTRQLNLNGRVNIPQNQPEKSIRFGVFRPGTIHQVEIPNDSDTITIKTAKENLSGILIHLHRVHGYRTGDWLFNAFVFFNDLASFSCILFALTGVYLWWKSTTKHFWGFVCLGISCAYSIGMIVYLLNAR